MPKTSRPADAVQIRFRILREIKIDDNVDRFYVDAAGEQVRGDQTPASSVPEVMEDAVAVRLVHARVDEEARVAELGDLLGQELDAGHRIAEDDGLVDLQLGKERVEAVHLLPLFDKCVVLRDALQGELVHQVDLVRVGHVRVLEFHDRHRERCGVHQDLPIGRQKLDEIFDDGLELRAEQFVGLIHDDHMARLEIAYILVG
mmetsp:Transcript_39479/g.88736  ORF Transcript_39479/g.88736 Transcript_39479/m.88736 type:complete len:202 (+) Transcript_39479:302-907(+)